MHFFETWDYSIQMKSTEIRGDHSFPYCLQAIDSINHLNIAAADVLSQSSKELFNTFEV